MKKSALALSILATCFIISCKKSQIEPPTPVPVFEGKVIVYDEGSQMIDNNGVKVSVENSSPEIAAITDSQGNFSFQLNNLPDLFAIVFNKPGIGTYKSYLKKSENDLYEMGPGMDYHKVSGMQTYQFGYKSSVIITNFVAGIVNNKLNLNFNVSSPNINGEKYVRILLQKDLPGISINTVTNNIKNVSSVLAVQNGNNSFEFCLSCFMECHQYAPGDKIYLTAYGDALYSNWYTDLSSGQWKFPNLNFVENNPISSFMMP